MAIETGRVDAVRALQLLPTVEDHRARALTDRTLRSENGPAIDAIARQMSAAQCTQYLPELKRALLEGGVKPKVELIRAVARAGGGQAAEVLAEFIDKSPWPIAGVAFGALEGMGSTAKPALLRLMTTAGSSRVRETAAYAVSRLGGSGVAETLRSAQDGGARHQTEEEQSLLPREAGSVVREFFHRALGDVDGDVRIAAGFGLARLGIEDGVAEVRRALSSKNIDQQIEATVLLAAASHPDQVERLRTFLRSPDEAIRGKAVWAMARSGSARLKALAYELKLDATPVYRSMLAEKLLDPRNPRDLKSLRSFLDGPDEMSALIAARRLMGSVPRGEIEAVVSRGLNSNAEHVRRYALNLASESPGLAGELISRIRDSDPLVRVVAIRAVAVRRKLDRLQEVEASVADASPDVSLAAAEALLSLDAARASKFFEKNLSSDLSRIRVVSAAMLLRRAGSATSP